MKRIKRNLVIYLILCLTALTGCQNDGIDFAEHNRLIVPVNISANALTMPDADKNTRTALNIDENTIVESQILLFDENDLYIGLYPVISQRVAIPLTSAKRSLYIIANAETIIASKSDFWISGITPASDIISSLIQSNNTGEMPDMPFVMYAKLELPDGINSNSAISSDGTHSGSSLLLKRNVAKVTIDVEASLSESFIIDRIMMCNVPKNGYLITDKPITDELNCYDLMKSGTAMYSFSSTPDVSVILEARSKINGVFEINPRYYKVSVKNPQNNQSYGLKHNNWYKISIVSKSGDGYQTLDDAINGSVMNQIATTIEVRDITMHDYIFGKDYYIGTSNSHYEQYGHKTSRTAYEVCKVKFANAFDNEDLLGHTSVKVLSGDISLTEESIAAISVAKNNETYAVEVRFDKSETEGIICLKYKDLVKYIYVKAALQPELNTDHVIEVPHAVSGNIETPDINWAGITSQEGTLCLILEKSDNLSVSREFTALFASVKTGMKRISVFQSPR